MKRRIQFEGAEENTMFGLEREETTSVECKNA
jgi:hypothetical protein